MSTGQLKIATVDLGGTKTSLAIFPSKPNAQMEKKITFETPKKPQDLLKILESHMADYEPGSLSGIGVGAAGYWDKDCILRQSINLPEYKGYPLWKNLSSTMGVPVYLKTDVELAALGEANYGPENRGCESWLYMNLGTGFSGALYKDGQIFSTSYSPTLRLDYLVYPELKGEDSSKTPARTHSDDIAASIMAIATNLINLSFILSPQVLCIGGGKTNAENWANVIQPAIDKALPYLSENLSYSIDIKKSSLDNATLWGALHLVRQSVGVSI